MTDDQQRIWGNQQRAEARGLKPGGNQQRLSQGFFQWSHIGCGESRSQYIVIPRVTCLREATEDSVPGFLLGDGPTDTLCPAHTKLSDLQRESSCSDRLGKWAPLTALFLSMQRTFTIQVPRGQQEVFSNTAASGLLVHYFLHTNIIKIFIGYNKYTLQYYLSALVTT